MSLIAPAAPLVYIATLVRGIRYDLKGKVFKRGVSVPVTQWEHDHLLEHAVERILRADYDPLRDDPEDAIERICALTFVRAGDT